MVRQSCARPRGRHDRERRGRERPRGGRPAALGDRALDGTRPGDGAGENARGGSRRHDVRVIDMQADPKESSAGTFVMTTTKLTRPSKYDVYITSRLSLAGGEQEYIVSRPITVKVDEVGEANATGSRQ